jgi:hypothetical protein
MDNEELSFGDNVRVRSTPETVTLGIAGLAGQVYGFTTPSVTGVSVIGDTGDDYALNVSISGRGSDFWLAAHLLEFIDHAPGMTVSVDGSPTQSVRNADGTWRREPKPESRRKPWWKLW